MANIEYKDWDGLILQLNMGKEGVQTIKMMRQDMEVMAENHGVTRADVVEMMLQALEEELKNSETPKEETDAVS
jgi:cupin superfamily acireductone dioxygenase involved in methionine salvage